MRYIHNAKVYNIPDKQIESLMKIGLTQQEAIETYLDDIGVTHNAEQEASVKKSKEMGRRYEQSKVRKPVHKERKVDETKGHLISETKTLLETLGATDLKVKTETEINFNYDDNNYTFKLTKHKKRVDK